MSQSMFKSFRPLNWSSSNKISINITCKLTYRETAWKVNETWGRLLFQTGSLSERMSFQLVPPARLGLGHVLEHFLLCRPGIRQRLEGRNFQPPCEMAMKVERKHTCIWVPGPPVFAIRLGAGPWPWVASAENWVPCSLIGGLPLRKGYELPPFLIPWSSRHVFKRICISL